MIGVYLRPDMTQMIRGRLRKNNAFELQEHKSIPQSYLEVFNSSEVSRQELIEELAFFFDDIESMMNTRSEEIYLVLPDYLFSMCDCFIYENDADLEERIKAGSNKNSPINY